jgi:AcrR family transcriptional regulator
MDTSPDDSSTSQSPPKPGSVESNSVDDLANLVLDTARTAYASRGYLGTTLKGVAAAAGVAPDVLKKYFDNRESLFAAAMRLPFDPVSSINALIAPGIDGLGERLVRVTLRMLDDPATLTQLQELMEPGGKSSAAVATVREFLESAVVDRVATVLGVADARLRVNVAVAHLIGAVACRYVLEIEPFASATEDQFVALVAPSMQNALTTPIAL